MSTHVHSVGRLTLVCFLVSIAGCGGYDEIGPVAYDFSKALYSITNRKAENVIGVRDTRVRRRRGYEPDSKSRDHCDAPVITAGRDPRGTLGRETERGIIPAALL